MTQRLCVFMASTLLISHVAFGQSPSEADPEIVAAIASIKAIDAHCHPEQVLAEGQTDTQWDAFPEDAYKAPRVPNIPANTRPRNYRIVAAWRSLWGIPDTEWSEQAVKQAMENKSRIKKEKGDAYPAWVLDQAGVEIALSNRITMQRGLTPPRFRWVSYGDLYMFPLSTAKVQAANPLYARFYAGLEQEAKALLSGRGGQTTPRTLAGWVSNVVTPTLEKQKRDGAIAVKFTAAYYRPLDFEPVSEREAAAIYASSVHGAAPGPGDYKKLQDYIFFEVAKTAGRLQMPIHIHCGTGAGAQYNMGWANPYLLERAFINLPDTDFVMIHGGWPYSLQATGLLNKSNVYADFSAQEFFLSPKNLADTIRYWLDYMPEKVLFGTDAYPNSGIPQASWEEFEWINTQLARQALALALTAMKKDGEISLDRAKELARMVMRDNTAKLHHL